MTKTRLVAVAVAAALSVVLLPVVTGNISFSPVGNSSEPHTPPPSPRQVRAASGSTRSGTGTLTVSHAAAASKDAITKYNATCHSSDGGATKRGAHNGPTAAPITVAGVTTKKTYRCAVTATNAQGTSTPSTESSAVIVGAPGQPHPPSVARIDPGHLKVSFGSPANNGATITSFKAVCKSSNGGVARGKTGAASPLGVMHLTPAKTYTCTVQATNRRGAGPVSAPSNAANARIALRNAQSCSQSGRADPNSSGPACATDVGVFRPSVGGWYVNGQAPVFFGLPGDIPVPGDYNGDGTTDRAVFRPSGGGWYVNGQAPVFFGLPDDIPVPGDYNGDGRSDIAVYRPSGGGWYVNGQAPVFFGLPGDIPVPGDYNGDGTTDVAVYRPSVGGWYVNGQAPVFFGLRGDIPVPGDYNGDGTTDIAVYRSGQWLIRNQPTVFLGRSGDVPVPGDYLGDGSTDPAVFRASVGGWFVNGQPAVFFGLPGDVPIPKRTQSHLS